MPANVLSSDDQFGFFSGVFTDGEEGGGVDSSGLVEDLLGGAQPVGKVTDPGGRDQSRELDSLPRSSRWQEAGMSGNAEVFVTASAAAVPQIPHEEEV